MKNSNKTDKKLQDISDAEWLAEMGDYLRNDACKLIAEKEQIGKPS